MGLMQLFPTSTKARLALVGGLTAIYILFSTVYMRYGGSAFPLLQPQPDDLGHHVELPTATGTPSTGNNTTPASPHSRILLVSAFFPLNTSKTTDAEYDILLANFLQTVRTDVYIYTPPEHAARIQRARAPGATLHLNTTFASVFDIPPLQGKDPMYTRIRIKDRERPRHSIESYAVLNAKPYFLQAAVSTLAAGGESYDYAFWNDALSFHREHAYRDWPAFGRVDKIWEDGVQATAMKKEELFFVPTWDLPHASMSYWHEGLGPVDTKYIETSSFGGPPAAVDWWARAFYAYHDHFLSLELFVGKDQALANTLALLFAPRLLTVWYNDPRAPAHVALLASSPRRTPAQSFLGQCGSEWFYYQFLMASEAERESMKERWLAEAGGWWGWWRARDTEPCKETRVLGMGAALRTRFGAGWNSPGAGVEVPGSVPWTV